MLSKADSRKKAGENSGTGKFGNDLEAISKALYGDKNLSRLASSTASSRSKSVAKSNLFDSKMKPKDAAKNNPKESLDKEKKPSIWSWKGLKALTHIRNRRFNCCFSLLVHSVEGLPSFFDDVYIVLHWKRRDGEQMTRPIRVYQGVAEIEEQLTHSCSVYGSRSGSHHSAKYEAKHFLLYASVYNAPELDLGKHRIDLTRLLPLTLEELEEEKSSGKWMTSFKLSGKAKGAKINVSFGYVVIGNNSSEPSRNSNVPDVPILRQNRSQTEKILVGQIDELSIRRVGSLPARLSTLNNSEEIKDLHEVLPVSNSELCESVNVLYQKLDEEAGNKLDVVDPHKQISFTPTDDGGEKVCETEWEISEFCVVEKGIEEFTKEEVRPKEDPSKVILEASEEVLETNDDDMEVPVDVDAALHNPSTEASEEVLEINDHDMEVPLDVDAALHNPSTEEITSQKDEESNMSCKESLMKELETALSYATDLVNEGQDSQDDESDALGQESHRKGKSLSLDDVTDSVASDFLNMLGIEHSPFGLSSESEPDSPRERLLKQFENDTLANGGLLNFDIENDPEEPVSEIPMGSIWEAISNDFYQSSICEGFQEIPEIDTDAFRAKSKASILEDLETEALMRDWGLNEKAFQHSPPSHSGGFGSPVDIVPPHEEVPQQLPPLGEGLGPFVQTKNGGFLRSMNPVLFKNAKSGGSLIMQVSSPVVVPAEMGSGVMDILQGLAAVGIEKLSMQANKLMPLEEINGKTMQQIAWEAAPSLEGSDSQGLFQHDEYEIRRNSPVDQKRVKGTSSVNRSGKPDATLFGNDTEYVSLEDLAPLAMDKIEALSVEGLRIQSGMSDEEAPSDITTQSIGEFSALKGKTLDGAGGLQLLDIKDNNNNEDVDGLMGLSLTLDEWMRLDSGEITEEDLVSERTSKVLAAHHATSLDLFRGKSRGDKKRGKGKKKYGLLGNNFTVALMVQLRDPLRNYEPVGTPMLALIQVERVFVPPKPRIYCTVPHVRNSDEEEKQEEVEKEVKAEKEEIIIEKPIEEELVPQYKITEVHVAGLKTEPTKKKLWGSTNQQQAGSRWLLANGMGKKNKHPLMKSKVVAKNSNSGNASSSSSSSTKTTTVQPGETLWSISSRVHGTGEKWKELAALNPHIRNPNVIFPNEKIRLC
ncbi:hypothetical protein ACP275_12G128600 [Erythranthe tilingii]